MLGPMTLIPSQDGVDRREEGTGLSRFLGCASVPWQVKEGKSWGQVLSVTQGERGGDRDTETDRNREDRQRALSHPVLLSHPQKTQTETR